LTAPGAVVEDTETTEVFPYSKVKQGGTQGTAAAWTSVAAMLHYNVVFARHRQTPPIAGRSSETKMGRNT
jgi:hypothetical protein